MGQREGDSVRLLMLQSLPALSLARAGTGSGSPGGSVKFPSVVSLQEGSQEHEERAPCGSANVHVCTVTIQSGPLGFRHKDTFLGGSPTGIKWNLLLSRLTLICTLLSYSWSRGLEHGTNVFKHNCFHIFCPPVFLLNDLCHGSHFYLISF